MQITGPDRACNVQSAQDLCPITLQNAYKFT